MFEVQSSGSGDGTDADQSCGTSRDGVAGLDDHDRAFISVVAKALHGVGALCGAASFSRPIMSQAKQCDRTTSGDCKLSVSA